MKKNALLIAIALLPGGGSIAYFTQAAPPQTPGITRIQVAFAGGHETDPRDNGRPVVLIAAALKVPPEVFREAFSRVHPAPAGTHPDPEAVHRNKAVLLEALGRYGVTNERLDEVSDYYRYVQNRGELWPTETAVAYAVFKHGKFAGFEVSEGGAGYSSPPSLSVPGLKTPVKVQLGFSTKFERNGSIVSITAAQSSSR